MNHDPPQEEFEHIPNPNNTSSKPTIQESRELSHTRADTPSLSHQNVRSQHKNGLNEHAGFGANASNGSHAPISSNRYVPSNISSNTDYCNGKECGVCHKGFGTYSVIRWTLWTEDFPFFILLFLLSTDPDV